MKQSWRPWRNWFLCFSNGIIWFLGKTAPQNSWLNHKTLIGNRQPQHNLSVFKPFQTFQQLFFIIYNVEGTFCFFNAHHYSVLVQTYKIKCLKMNCYKNVFKKLDLKKIAIPSKNEINYSQCMNKNSLPNPHSTLQIQIFRFLNQNRSN